jgi:hypothetical protein
MFRNLGASFRISFGGEALGYFACCPPRAFWPTITYRHVGALAAAHREHGQDVSESEQAAIDDIVAALNTTAG